MSVKNGDFDSKLRGTLITLEGIDGSGKSTQVQNIARYFSTEHGVETLSSFEPGATPFGQQIRSLFQKQEQTSINTITETFLFMCDRLHNIDEILRPNLKQGKLVICDRFHDSTIAYQIYGRLHGDPKWLIIAEEFNIPHQRNCVPHLTLLFDLDPKLAIERLKAKRDKSFFDKMPLEFMQRVRNGYLSLQSKYPHRIKIIDASQPLEKVNQQVINVTYQHYASGDHHA